MRQPLTTPFSSRFATMTSCAAHSLSLGSMRPAATSSRTHCVAASISAGDMRRSRCFTGRTSSPTSTMLNCFDAAICSGVFTGSVSVNTWR